jgi:eukaryotic-like serine/threonine-protein kinase
MGAVSVALALEVELDVALKVVKQSLIEDPQALARFKREARLVTELSHENIVASFDAGDDAGLLYIAMELLQGDTLRERLETRGRLTWQESLPIVEQMVRALAAAHDRGIVHRDLKPENVMLMAASDGSVTAKLLDFGVAKQARVDGESAASHMTGTGFIVGTPGYVAPEVVLEGRTDDPRTDFYALGVVWFEVLTGQKPFTAKTAFALAMRHAHEPPPTPTSFLPFSPVPAPVEELVLQLMEKAPEARPADAATLLQRITGLAEESRRALASLPAASAFDPTVTDAELLRRTDVMPAGWRPPSDAPPGVTPTPATAVRADGLADARDGGSDGALFRRPDRGWQPLARRLFLLAAVVLAAGLAGGGVVASMFLIQPAPARQRAPLPAPAEPPPDRGALVVNGAPLAAPVADPAFLEATPPAGEPRSVEGTARKADGLAKPLAQTRSGPPPSPSNTLAATPTPATPQAASATLVARVPKGVKLSIDGQLPREGHRRIERLAPGEHVLVFTHSDGRPAETRRVTLEPGQVLSFSGADDLPR